MSIPIMSLVLILAVVLLLVLVLKVKLQAFLALLIISMAVGLAMGMPAEKVFESMQNGMGSTLGFVATIIGLGAIFGQILESSGGARSLAHHLIRYFGKDRAQWAMVIAGFLIAIPVFFDVGFIILVPLVHALSRDTGKPYLYFGIPLLAGLGNLSKISRHSLFRNLKAPSMPSSLQSRSFCTGAAKSMKSLTVSAPYFSIISSGSTILPTDFDILAPSFMTIP